MDRGDGQPTVIRRKLEVPPLGARVIAREALERGLAARIEAHPLVLISATAGAGKTTAAVRALAHVHRPVAWLTLDRTDQAPGRLLEYLEAALARVIPAAGGVTRPALAAGLAHAEAAGLLAEAAGDASAVLVLDELERLDHEAAAWAVIEALARYAPPGVRLVLIGRRDPPGAIAAQRPDGTVAAFGEVDLAFSTAEAAEALAAAGVADVDPAGAVEATGGWVTGVLFEAWRSADHAPGVGGEADGLFGYLAAQIMDGLAAADARFLVRTAVLDEVTVRGAEALGETEAGERLTALRAAHLPVSWHADGGALRCHARFREYLLARVERLPSHEVARLRLGHGRLLAADGLHEEATDELLRAGARDEALDSAEHAIVGVIDRLDLAVAERWVSELGSAHRADMLPMLTAELMLAVAREDYRHGRQLADRVEAEGRRKAMAAASPRCAALMAWCYLHAGRIDDVRALLDVAPDDPTVDAVRWALRPLRDGPAEMLVPAATGGAVDALLLRACYHLGRLTELTDTPHSRWAEAVTEPWRIGALRATGRTQLALELYEAARADGVGAVGLHAQVGPELLIDTGREQEARAALVEGRDVARRSGSLIFELFNGVVAAKLELRLARDPWAAQGVLHRLERELGARRFPHVREMVDTWFGMALLLQNDNAEALRRLRRAVAGMLAGDRLLELPTAAVFLAEAEWRAGEEERADRAADLAVDAAGRQGSNHMLIQALTDFPATVSRRIDAEPGVDSVWHDLGRALAARDVPVEGAVGDPVVLEEFGPPAIVVAGEPTRPRIAKSYELLAYLALRHPTPVTREELLDALFAGRADESARSYLRQAAHQLRQVLPGDDAVVTEGARMRLADGLRLTAESQRLERDLGEANRLRGEERLTATLNALRAADRGPYLAGVESDWVAERRRQLQELATTARYEAGELAFTAGRLDDARRLAREVLGAEPFREPAWRLTMRIAGALGDDHGVVTAFRSCERALGPFGIEPSRGTRQLLERLRA